MKEPGNGGSEALIAEEHEEGGGDIIGACIAVPEGRYKLQYMYYETGYFKDQPKVIVHFAIVEHDSYTGTPVERFYNVDELKGPPRKYGGFKASARRMIARETRMLMGEPKRFDRISFVSLRRKRILGEVITVTHDHKKQPLAPSDQYSRIDRFIEVLPEDDW